MTTQQVHTYDNGTMYRYVKHRIHTSPFSIVPEDGMEDAYPNEKNLDAALELLPSEEGEARCFRSQVD